MELRRSFSLFLAITFLFTAGLSSAQAYKFFVGGRDGWVRHPAEDYNHWAGRMRFLINDTLYFKYKKGEDSVLLVTGEDYSKCNTKKPIKEWDDGGTLFQFDRSGPFFFISGKDGNCQQGQKLIVVVLALRHPPPIPVPTPPATPPTSAPPPKGLPPTSTPPPASTPTGEPPASLPPAPGASPPGVFPPPPASTPTGEPPASLPPAPVASPPGVFPPKMPPAMSPPSGEPPASMSPSPEASPPTGPTPTASPMSTPAPSTAPTTSTVPSMSSPQGAPSKSPPATSFPVTTSPPPPPPPNSDASVSGPPRLWASMAGLILIVILW